MGARVDIAEQHIPAVSGPLGYLWWLTRCQPGRTLLGAFWGSTWMVALMVPPYLISRAIDDGLRTRDTTALLGWAAAIAGVALLTALLGLARHRTMSLVRLDGSLRTARVVSRHALQLGAVLPRRVAAGEVVHIGASDISQIAEALTITGPGVGSVIAYLVVAALLVSVSPLLAVVVLCGVPLLCLLMAPLLGRLQKAETEYREQQGTLVGRATDIVSGLRVLCGIGGKDMFAERYVAQSRSLRAEGYRVGAVVSLIHAMVIGAPGLFTALVTWLAARMVAAGDITAGEMVAVYGYVAVLIVPVSFLIGSAYQVGRALVAARRVTQLLAVRPAPAGGGAGPAGPAPLYDPESEVNVPPGSFVAIAPARPADGIALVDRLGRYTGSAVVWGEQPLAAVTLDEVRRRIVVADNDAYLFAGPLADAVAGAGDHNAAAIDAALDAAAALDIVDGLPDGVLSTITGQGRNLSGGQRQRIRLARALLHEAEVLLLVEPTSAVDAHTEALIADRLVAARAGRTTVVVTTSPLVLSRAGHVIHLVDGRVAATGPHTALLRDAPAYRALVLRGDDDAELAPAQAALR